MRFYTQRKTHAQQYILNNNIKIKQDKTNEKKQCSHKDVPHGNGNINNKQKKKQAQNQSEL